MKNCFNFCILSSIIFLSGCSDFLEDDNRSRLTPITIEDHLSTMNGSFSPFLIKETRTHYLSDDFEPHEEAYSKRLFDQYYIGAMTWTDPIFRPGRQDIIWGDGYHAIWTCNNILFELEDYNLVVGEDQELYNRARGEALAHRARLYSDLINYYAKHYDPSSASSDLGVPLNLGTALDVQWSRSTVAEVYDLIINDLNEAAELLPPMTPNFPSSAFRPGAASAHALSARIHLYRQEWEEAVNAANKCLSIYDFVYDYTDPTFEHPNEGDVFSGEKPFELLEAIWYQRQGAQTGYSFIGTHSMSKDLIAQFDTTGSDLRWNLFARTSNDEVIYIRAGLCWPDCGGTDYIANWGIGIPEVILTLAEAQARLGNISEAMTTLDGLTRYRYDPASYTPPSASDMSEALDIIISERRKENPFVGLRWFDQKRLITLGEYDKTLTRFNEGQTFTLEPNSLKYVGLIPQDVIDLNATIEQNPR